jgi:hypothetical protein
MIEYAPIWISAGKPRAGADDRTAGRIAPAITPGPGVGPCRSGPTISSADATSTSPTSATASNFQMPRICSLQLRRQNQLVTRLDRPPEAGLVDPHKIETRLVIRHHAGGTKREDARDLRKCLDDDHRPASPADREVSLGRRVRCKSRS